MPLRRRARRPFATDPAPASSTPSRSAAWLAGERLFGAAPAPVPDAPVVVTIRRSRLAAPAPAAPDAVAPPEDTDGKGPRVFRVEAANEAAPGALDEPPAAEEAPPRPARRQRIGVDRRPGPVVVQVFAPEPSTPQAEPPFAGQLALLRAALAEVERLLAEAQRAQALRFDAA